MTFWFSSKQKRASEASEICFREAAPGKVLVNVKKCTFMKLELVYLGFVISRDGLKMDLEKVQEIIDWPSPRNIFEVRIFHGLESFYRKFIKNFSGISAYVFETIKNDRQPFQWTVEAERSF